jgi:transposase
MLNQNLRTAILELYQKGLSKRRIARLLQIARNTVSKVIASQSRQPSPILRSEKAEAHREEILELYRHCKGNLVRVHEELEENGVRLAYPTLTRFCRKHGIGVRPPKPVGRYHFEPGRETQHDTSPHMAQIAGKNRQVQTTSAVLAYSTMTFFQCYPQFRRFECKVFLHDALTYFDGVTDEIMVDNTHVIVSSGTGEAMIPAPEMEAFASRYGFRFRAHEVGDVNRSTYVERPFHHIENNFFAGRSFADWQELNEAARAWCDKINGRYKRSLRARPIELFAVERTRLRPLPEWLPEPEKLRERIVDVYGYVTVNTNRYSAPVDWIGRRVQVRETKERIEITLDHHHPSVSHARVIDKLGRWNTLPEHRSKIRRRRRDPPPELDTLLKRAPETAFYAEALKKKSKKPFVLTLRHLLRMVHDYPKEPLLEAMREADQYGLYDLDRLETMVLRRIGQQWFPFHSEDEGDQDD